MINYTCGPYRFSKMKLCKQYRDYHVSGDAIFVSFEKEIIWNKRSESEVQIWHGSRKISTEACYNDYYGFMTSQAQAAKLAIRLLKNYDITRDSSLYIIVRTTVTEVPLFRSPQCEVSDLSDDKLRHQLEAVYDQGWLIETHDKLETVTISSDTTWDSRDYFSGKYLTDLKDIGNIE